jgi:AraC family transcriptional regulator, chitin signaling transcriptional activator
MNKQPDTSFITPFFLRLLVNQNASYVLLWAIGCIFSISANAQELLPFQNFAPDTYHGETQNWNISQSINKNIFIANNKGLIEYNGATWKLYPSPNHTIIRSVKVIDNRIYTGSYMEFGYWQKDNHSVLHYHSLSTQIRDKLLFDEQYWKIIGYRHWVLFQSLHRIYIYDTRNQTFRIVTAKTSLPKVFEANQSIYFQKMDNGLYTLDNGNPVLLSDHPVFRKNIVINIFPFGSKLLVQTQNAGFYLCDHNNVTAWKNDASAKINTLSIYCSIRLKDGSFALGTIGEGLYIVSPNGKITMHFDKKNGLQNNTILTLFEDADNNIWMGLDNGVSVLNYSSPFRAYFDTKGIFGTVYAAAYYHGLLYLGTNQGLFYRPLHSTDDFKLIPSTQGQVWTLKIINETLFCGHNSGTFVVNGTKATLICDVLGTWNIQPVENNPNLLIQGNYEGLHILERTNSGWHYRNKIEGFDISSRYFELFPGNNIFVSHEYHGVFVLRVTPDFKRITQWQKVQSAPKCANSGMIKYENRLFYLCNAGLFEYDREKNRFQQNATLTRYLLGKDTYLSGKLILDEKQSLWAFTEENLVRLSPAGMGNAPQMIRIPLSLSLRENVTGFENIIPISNQEYLLGSSNGYILLDLKKMNNKNYTVTINSIEKNEQNQKKITLPVVDNNCRLTSRENNLCFHFNVPVYDRFLQTTYQYQLDGLDNTWSDWSKEPQTVFKNLPSGDYTFKVRARVGNTPTSNTAVFHFHIARVWYLSVWMLLFYVFLFIVLLLQINYQYKKRYLLHKQRIEEEKQKEVTLMQLQNEQALIQLRNEKLSYEVETKNKKLASTSMAIVKKNELLTTIKAALIQEQNNRSVKSALKIIDDGLDNTKDWEAFKDAFNTIDRDFLQKIKQLHPALTPNDLKLCAYLRLNLSSKEIAPMLSISPQSVEIKRFRIRKKIGLDHDQNLTEYILNL